MPVCLSENNKHRGPAAFLGQWKLPAEHRPILLQNETLLQRGCFKDSGDVAV